MKRGGKLLLVGGWVDDLPPQNVVTYYENVVRTLGADQVRDSVRLFMVPGMHHCFGGTCAYPNVSKCKGSGDTAIRRASRVASHEAAPAD